VRSGVDPGIELAAKIIARRVRDRAARYHLDAMVREFNPGASRAHLEVILDYAAERGWLVRDGGWVEPGEPVPVEQPEVLTEWVRRLRWGPGPGGRW
jgi:hypothetical protein